MPTPGSELPNSRPKRPTLLRRLLKAFAALTMVTVIGAALLLAALWREHRTEVTLPQPTGPFAVGRTTYAWVNEAQTDDLAPSPGMQRAVLAWIWYPSAGSSAATPAEYLPSAWREALARSSGVLRFLTRGTVHTHSSSDPGISQAQHSYPVVIMRAGGGALTTSFTTLAEDLASHGYVVVGFDAPYRTVVVVFPDGRVVLRPRTMDPEVLPPADQTRLIDKILSMWSGDTRFVVDQLDRLNAADPSGRFSGRLDMGRLGMFGHSLGGATALQFCHDDFRCKAGIDIDGAPYGSVVKDGLTQPFLFLLSDHGDLSALEARAVLGDIVSIYDRLPNGRRLLMVRGANHFSFSDQMLVMSRYFVRLLQLFQGGLDGPRGLTITTAYVHNFFDVYLKGAPTSRLDNLRQAFPEVQAVRP
jgi:dienelactone hydrolase